MTAPVALQIKMEVRNMRQVTRLARMMPDAVNARMIRLVGKYGRRVERDAKRAAPVNTGQLKSSINTILEVGRYDIRARVGTDVEHGWYQEYGTGLHGPRKRRYPIVPKRAKVLAIPIRAGRTKAGKVKYLRITKRGRVSTTTRYERAQKIFRKSVMHPGVAPRPFLRPAFWKNVRGFRRELSQIIARFWSRRMRAYERVVEPAGEKRRFARRFRA